MPRPDAVVAIDLNAPEPPYVQIFEQLRAMIERGDVQPGDALPPVRQLAGDLGVAPNTVARAYADLKAERWIEGQERRTTRVAAGAPARARTSRRKALADAVTTFLASLANRGYAPEEIAIELQRRLGPIDG